LKRFKYLQQLLKQQSCAKGFVRSITEYYILQHELTTAMQYQFE